MFADMMGYIFIFTYFFDDFFPPSVNGMKKDASVRGLFDRGDEVLGGMSI